MVNTKAHDALTATAREATLRALRDEMERRGLVRVHRGRDGRRLWRAYHGRDVMPKLTDPTFRYTNAASTDIRETLRRHGFKPTTERDRAARQKRSRIPDVEPTVLRFRRKRT